MTVAQNAMLSSAYLGPIQYYSKLVSYPNIIIDKHENYQKQSYRNRCSILSGNGPVSLSIPIFRGPRAKAPMRDIQLSFDMDWQRQHWRTLVSAYNNSPFFEYFQDDFAPFYHEKKWKFLLDFNEQLQQTVLDILEVSTCCNDSSKFVKHNETDNNTDDYRLIIHPKTQRAGTDKQFKSTPYTQVFSDKMNFIPNLSIIDLLFNEGMEALTILENCMVKEEE